MTWSATASRVAAVAGGGLLATLAGLAARYSSHQKRIERSWLTDIAPRLDSIGEVDILSIVPVVERLASTPGLKGEPGVSYVIRAGNTRLLFDTGLNVRGASRPALVQNADRLAVNLQGLDGVVISHLHADHVGGPRTQFRKHLRFLPMPSNLAASRHTSLRSAAHCSRRRTCSQALSPSRVEATKQTSWAMLSVSSI
jgi:metallo-beta-lactamase superfamily protein